MDANRTAMQLPRLDDSNFEFWRQSVQLIASAMKITKYVTEKTTIANIANDDDRKATFLLTNAMLLSMSDKARRIATGAGGDSNLQPFEMMERLETHYLPTTTSSDIQLRRQLYRMRYTNDKVIEVFANEIRSLVNRINSAEKKRVAAKGGESSFIGDRDMIAVLVMSLPNEYDMVVTLIEKEGDYTFEKAVELVRTREQRLKSGSGESSSANAVQTGGKKFPPCDVCGRNGHSAARCFQNGNRRGAQRGGRRGRGWGCQKAEAKEVEVEELDGFPVNFLPAENDKYGDPNEIKNLFRRGNEEMVLLTLPNDQLWIVIDSGCSIHVCGAAFAKYMSEWHDGPEVTVRVADGNPHISKRYGTFRARVETANGARNLVIRDVLFVEPIQSMLVSVSKLCRGGYSVDFHGNRCTLRDSQGQTLEVLKKAQENLFRLPLTSGNSQKRPDDADDVDGNKSDRLPKKENNSIVAFFSKTTSENIRAWHYSLGHPGIGMMTSLSNNGKIPKFNRSDIAEVVTKCPYCNVAKARALPVPDQSENRVTKIMERIHCDAVTKLPATFGRKMGFSLIVDEFSKFIDVKLITHKNETQDHIKEFVAKMAAHGHRVGKL